MSPIFSLVLAAIVLLAFAMQAWRRNDLRADDAGWAHLRGTAGGEPRHFDALMVQGLPEAARRYFLFMIATGTPLSPVTGIRMSGEIGLGSKAAPGYKPMQARQILAPPHGFIWQVVAGSGVMQMSGSDGMLNGRSWTRFWLDRMLPVVRAGGNGNHLRSSFGRVVAEAAFWAPASLLPGPGVQWEAGDRPSHARAIVTRGALTQALEIEVADDGQPLWVLIPRWSNANLEKQWRVQPFGGTLAGFKLFGGYTLPTIVEGGNHFGTDDYFAFYRAQIESIVFPSR